MTNIRNIAEYYTEHKYLAKHFLIKTQNKKIDKIVIRLNTITMFADIHLLEHNKLLVRGHDPDVVTYDVSLSEIKEYYRKYICSEILL